MQEYLCIANPGEADVEELILLGVGGENSDEFIRQFHSGSKLGVIALLRKGIFPTYCVSRHRLTFTTKPIDVRGRIHQKVVVIHSGSRNKTQELDRTLGFGQSDWEEAGEEMALREFLANALDGAWEHRQSFSGTTVRLATQITAQSGWTQVYIPYTAAVKAWHEDLNNRFLHFRHKELLKLKCLPKVGPDDKTYVYKKGVRVAVLNNPSVYDYNLGGELRLDESRNAMEWDVKYAVAAALKDAPAAVLAPILKRLSDPADPRRSEYLEACLASDYLAPRNQDPERLKARQKEWRAAWEAVAGPTGVATNGNTQIDAHLEHKGLTPRAVPGPWLKALGQHGVETEDTALTTAGGRKGETYGEPRPAMLRALDDVWILLTEHHLTNGKEKPPCKSFTSIMTGGSQKLGEYRDGTVYLHADLAPESSTEPTPALLQTMLEEVVHHVTDAADGSRDIQDFLFRLAVAQAWGVKK